MNSPKSFACIGAGNVASHLCKGLTSKGFILRQVHSRTQESCKPLALKYNADYTTKISGISKEVDFYIVSVSDLSLPAVLSAMEVNDKLIIHTSGSTGIEVFKDKFSRYGILYPLQTFSMHRQLDLSKVPFFIEGSDPQTTDSILEIARKLSGVVQIMDSHQRKLMHIAAVLVSNFTNHMYTSAYDMLDKQKLDFSLLFPLMDETLLKAKSGKPPTGQTGPARRGDSNIVNDHIKTLSSDPDLQKLYTFMSSNIMEYYLRYEPNHLKNG